MNTNNYWTITDPANTPTSELIKKAKSVFENVYIYDEENIDTQFPPPEKDIIVSFLKSYEPDSEHRNKSYDDFISEKDKTYMNFRQYLILVLFVWETEKKRLDLDEKGWTRTSSLWSDGNLVSGYADGGGSDLCMGYGSRVSRDSGSGPRECFFTLEPSPFIPSSEKSISQTVLELEQRNITLENKLIKITNKAEELLELISNQ